jgi:predicted phosphodiesterase
MKVLLAGDTHGNTRHVLYLIRRARIMGCDRVFVVGDFGYWEHTLFGIEFMDTVSDAAREITVYFLDGNHDKTSLLLEKYDTPEYTDPEGFLLVRPQVRYARRGHRWTWDDCRFIALGGARSVDKKERLEREVRSGRHQSEWFPEEEMSDEDMKQILQDTSLVDVILAHDKPRGSEPGWNRKDYDFCLPNQDRLQRAVETLDPKYFIHGHLHYPYVYQMWHSHHGITRDMHITTVVGLDCDGNAGKKDRSWSVFDTDVVNTRERGVGPALYPERYRTT